jgi:hypothetical protein
VQFIHIRQRDAAEGRGEMPIKLKLDKDGHPVVNDGNPVCVDDDGNEFTHDIDGSVRKILNFTEAKKRHEQKMNELKQQLDTYGDLDPEAAREALETVANYKDKKLTDAEGVKILKQQMRESFQGEKEQLIKTHNETVEGLNQQRQADRSLIFKLMVTNKFGQSEYFTGEQPKTIYPPEDAAKIFGEYFKVEGEGNDAKVVAYMNNNPILSRENHGEPADFNEAIKLIIDQHPNKHRFLVSKKGTHRPGGGNQNPDSEDNKHLTGTQRIAQGLKKLQQQ